MVEISWKEKVYSYRNAKRKPPQTEENELKLTKEKQLWRVDNWKKMIFRDESRISSEFKCQTFLFSSYIGSNQELPHQARVDRRKMAFSKALALSDYLMSYCGVYLSAEMQSVYSTAPIDWAAITITQMKMRNELHSIFVLLFVEVKASVGRPQLLYELITVEWRNIPPQNSRSILLWY